MRRMAWRASLGWHGGHTTSQVGLLPAQPRYSSGTGQSPFANGFAEASAASFIFWTPLHGTPALNAPVCTPAAAAAGDMAGAVGLPWLLPIV